VPTAPAKPEAKSGEVLSEADALALAKKSNCLVCHSLDKKSVGPAWRAVAVKYRGDAGAEARLMEKIIKGGKGVWGAAAMPPNPQVSEADRRKLIRFILSLK
jgi:cytochrome c